MAPEPPLFGPATKAARKEAAAEEPSKKAAENKEKLAKLNAKSEFSRKEPLSRGGSGSSGDRRYSEDHERNDGESSYQPRGISLGDFAYPDIDQLSINASGRGGSPNGRNASGIAEAERQAALRRSLVTPVP